jgi:hypothetical protein
MNQSAAKSVLIRRLSGCNFFLQFGLPRIKAMACLENYIHAFAGLHCPDKYCLCSG